MPDPVRVRIAVEAPQHSAIAGPLDYTSEQMLAYGTLVRVPLGRREVPGLVWAADDSVASTPAAASPDDPAAALRAVQQVLHSLPPLSARWCELVAFAAAYYQRGIGEVAMSVLPPELRKLGDAQLERRIARLRKTLDSPEAKRGIDSISPPPDSSPDAGPSIAHEAELTGALALSAEQAQALAQFSALARASAHPVVLLHGATGSGKTEVYLRAAEQVLASGRQVLVLVPEINLTPQLEARFGERFGAGPTPRRIVSLHSGLTPSQRLRHWLAAHLGLADLVLGTRLAVFASLPRLGLIVVDEEHDPSYKQQEGARYSARDLAVYRGRLEGAPVILGSATPSLESWQRAEVGRYSRLSMPARIGGGALPQVRIVDMNQARRAGLGKGGSESQALSPQLVAALQQRIACGEQSLVFLNRRGYAPVLHCGACGWKSACPHCSAWRVFHKLDRSLRCHHCGFAQAVPRACPDCGNTDIAPIGRGTERLEEQLALALPEARVARIDADSTRLKGSLESQLGAVHAGEVDVLVGTQMIAKGHDFRRITLVAAVNPDSALFSSDFRAPERLFALLMQAAGRAGRDAEQAERSEMWVQTWHPQHALYAALRKHDFAAFAASQLKEREMAGLPPFSHLALLRAEARSTKGARDFLQAASDVALEPAAAAGVMIYSPVPPGVARVANVERMQMLVESPSRVALQRMLSEWLPQLHALRAGRRGEQRILRWAVDVDPLTI
ncbi:MAG: primosomal protein N' [Burkholderiales bacterium]